MTKATRIWITHARRELWVLALYFSVVHFGAVGFFVESLPSNDVVPVPPYLWVYAIGAQLILAAALYATDRVLASRNGDRALHAFRVTVFALCLALIVRRLEIHVAGVAFVFVFAAALHAAIAVALWLGVLAAIVVVALKFHRRLASAFVYLSIVAVVLTVMWTNGDLAADALYDGYSTAEVRGSQSTASPIVVLVFDELSYEALLDETGTIDAGRYPSFARLGSESLAFSNATTNYFSTWFVLPMMIDAAISLTPDRDLVLYEQTARIERVYATGCGTAYTCRGAGYLAERDRGVLAAQVSVRGLHRAVPGAFRPAANRLLGPTRDASGALDPRADVGGVHTHTEEMFNQFVADIGRGDLSGRVNLVHPMVPHGPYVYTRDGRVDRHERMQFSWANPQTGAAAAGIRQAYDDQLAYADAELGRVLQALEEAGVYDDASLIVTADHGVRTEGPRLDGSAMEVDSLMPHIPLFIRTPGLAHRWTDADYQHIDFALTLEDIAGMPSRAYPPAASHIALDDTQPISALAETRPERRKTFFVYDAGGAFWEYVADASGSAWTYAQLVEDAPGDRTQGLASRDDDVH
ncbi:MAG: sulfatase-like hydrolase/transferase [Dehalococcoidia bacterium]